MNFLNMLKTLSLVVLAEKSTLKFALGVLLGLAFSIAVILSTVGIMDGFEESLKKNLRKAEGDVVVYAKSSFFEVSEIEEQLDSKLISVQAPYLQTEGFFISEDESQGVLVKGIQQNFYEATGLDYDKSFFKQPLIVSSLVLRWPNNLLFRGETKSFWPLLVERIPLQTCPF
jgi:ABC-type lipoprotein release transport system permease subunit